MWPQLVVHALHVSYHYCSIYLCGVHQVNPRDVSNDFDPRFIAEFHKNLKVLGQVRDTPTEGCWLDTFHLSLRLLHPLPLPLMSGPFFDSCFFNPLTQFTGDVQATDPTAIGTRQL